MIDQRLLHKAPRFREMLRRGKGGLFRGSYICACPDWENERGEHLLALVDHSMLPRILHRLLDEAQFLSRDQVYQLTEVVDRLNIPVLCFGLRTDFQGELFEGSRHLLAWADELQELKTICHTGRKATMVVRVDENGYALREGSQVEIGGNDRYVSVCRKEFKNVFFGGQPVKLIDPLETRAEAEDPGQDELLEEVP